MARPEILTKKFWPSGPRSNYFLLPPSCAGVEEGEGVPCGLGSPPRAELGASTGVGQGQASPTPPGPAPEAPHRRAPETGAKSPGVGL